MIISTSLAKTILIILLLIFIISTLIVSSIIADKIPKEISNRLKELNVKLLDGGYALRDLTFHRFFQPNYLGELKKINAEKKDGILSKSLQKRRNLLVYLTVTFIIAALATYFYFKYKIK
jgi:hypothetical protein